MESHAEMVPMSYRCGLVVAHFDPRYGSASKTTTAATRQEGGPVRRAVGSPDLNPHHCGLTHARSLKPATVQPPTQEVAAA